MILWRYRFLYLCLFFLTESHVLYAQDVLPQGVIFYQYLYRHLTSPAYKYDETGTRKPIGEMFSRVLSGPELLNGNGGSLMQTLAQEIKKYDGADNGPNSLSNKLYLGTITGDIKGKMTGQGIGFGIGITDHLSIFVGVPIVSVSVDANLVYNGEGNNAAQIKEELGDIAFDELKDGLNQAAGLNQAKIEEQIASYEYAPLGKWQKSGIGHVVTGVRMGWIRELSRAWSYGFGPAVSLTFPTGYKKNPDILQDVGFGEPYYSLGTNIDQKFSLLKRFHVGVHTGYVLNLSNSIERRVPEGAEQLVPASRKSAVKITPGDDTDVALSLKFTVPFFEIGIRSGIKRHYNDTYNGSLDGNYRTLGKGSDKEVFYNHLSLSFETLSAFMAKKFSFPFLLTFAARVPMKSRNMVDTERYYELNFSSFLPTPWMEEKKKDAEDVKDKEHKQRKKKHPKKADRPF